MLNLGVTGSILAQGETPVITKGSAGWSYLNITDGVDPAVADTDFNTTWYNPTTGGYNGPAFTAAAQAPFHYGGVDGLSGGTVLIKPDSGNRHTAYYYKSIDGGAEGYENLNISLLADDGAFVYLNGILIGRDGVSDPDTFTKSASLGNEDNFDTLTLIGNPVLQPGPNLLAISVHNTSPTSSDLGVDLSISGDVVLVAENSTGWAMLSPIETATGDGFDPVTGHTTLGGDPDFNTTWRNQSFATYPGLAYNGPAFTTEHQGYFAYGGVNGLPLPVTTIPIPNSGSRGAAYFIKEIDGGANGYRKATFTILADDGAYIYLNGNLVGLIGDLPNDVAQDTWNKQTGANGSETTFHTLTVYGEDIIQPGANLLAVSLHQTASNSSDLGFSLKLIGETITPPTIIRGPYLQSGSHDRMTVKWRTDGPGDTVLRYGDAPGNLTQTVTINENVIDHTVTVTGLIAATQFYYQIESNNFLGSDSAGEDADHYFKTHPAPGSRTPARVWVIGDSGTTSTGKYNVYNAYRTRTGNAHTDAWLMLGDNAYGGGADSEFQAGVFDSYPELLRNTVLWSCIGNHETDYGNRSVYPDIHHFPTAGECGGIASGSELYYSFNHGNIHFICLNTANNSGTDDIDDVPGNGGMIDWLEMDLQAVTQDWIVAYFHHGPYTKGSHDSDTESRHIKARNYMTPLLEKYGVDLVLSGHSHLYERSMLVNGHHSNMDPATSSLSGDFVPETHIVDGGNGSSLGSNPDPLATIDSSGVIQVGVGADGAYEKPLAQGETGSVYIIAGASGKVSSRETLADGSVDYHPVFLMSLQTYGSCIITTDGVNSMNVQYLDSDITGDGKGKIRDDFTIVKGSTVEVAATDNTFGEYGGDNTATFTLSRVGATSFAETVNYTISGTATNGIDYTPSFTGTVSFAADETSKTLSVTRTTDDLAEGSESLSITLSQAQQTVGSGNTLRDRYILGANDSGSATLADSPSELWWFNNFGSGSVSNAMWDSDLDNDGLDSLMEYALGGTIGPDDSALLPTHQLNGNTFDLLYNKNNALTDIIYTAYTSTDLDTWTETGVSSSLNGASNPGGVEMWKSSVDLGPSKEKIFLRLEINRQ